LQIGAKHFPGGCGRWVKTTEIKIHWPGYGAGERQSVLSFSKGEKEAQGGAQDGSLQKERLETEKTMISFGSTEPKFIVILWELKPGMAWDERQLRHGVSICSIK